MWPKFHSSRSPLFFFLLFFLFSILNTSLQSVGLKTALLHHAEGAWPFWVSADLCWLQTFCAPAISPAIPACAACVDAEVQSLSCTPEPHPWAAFVFSGLGRHELSGVNPRSESQCPPANLEFAEAKGPREESGRAPPSGQSCAQSRCQSVDSSC